MVKQKARDSPNTCFLRCRGDARTVIRGHWGSGAAQGAGTLGVKWSGPCMLEESAFRQLWHSYGRIHGQLERSCHGHSTAGTKVMSTVYGYRKLVHSVGSHPK